jgi:hypothetical protein
VASPFFFSYAHNDIDEHLTFFFEQVSARVRKLTGATEKGFRDTDDMRAGELWGPRLAAELNSCRALVALYSPSYFKSTVCARELQVFLERRRKYMRENVGRNPASIIPVLWQVGEIPRSLPEFHHEGPRSEDLKGKEGAWYVRNDGRRKEFDGIIHSVAKRVKESMELKLPSLPSDPVLTGVTSAFEPPPLPPAEFDAAGADSGPRCATFVFANAPAWTAWPFTPGEQPLLHIAAAVAKGKDLETHQLTFDPAQPNLLERLSAARRANNLTLFLVDGTSLSDRSLAERLRQYDGEKPDAVGTLVVWPPGAKAARDLVSQVFPNLSPRQPPLFWPEIQAAKPFADAVGETLDRLSNDVLKAPAPETPPHAPTPYASVPIVSNQVRP